MIEYRLDSSGSGLGPMMLSREHSNGTSRFIPGYEFLVQLSDCQLLKKDCANVTANPLQCV